MHPAYSVIIFTTASGAGYGLLMLLAAGGALGIFLPERWLGIAGFGLAFLLITAGLLSSTAHLGRPERAWRAFSQWRSSWLSREGVAAVATYAPAVLGAIGWVYFRRADGVFGWLLGLAALFALVTVICTGQIYATLTTIRQWNQPLTTPVYVGLALATGALLLHPLLILSGENASWASWFTFELLLAAALLKLAYWRDNDSAAPEHTIEAATGLGALGKVRVLDPPHSRPNYVMREMGYAVARKHAQRLRTLVTLLLFVAPMALSLVSLMPQGALAASLTAVLSAAVGVFIERWLFFAEAEHVSMLYYGRESA